MPKPNEKLRIMLADDHPILRQGVKALVNSQADMEVVGEAGDGRAAWDAAKRLQPDVIVMDVNMPELNGTQATERIKHDCPHVKILALTLHEEHAYLRRLLQAGASGYVLKRAAGEELLHAIRAVAGGGTYLDPSIAGKLIGATAASATATARAPKLAASDLGEREREVLGAIAHGYSNKEIAADLGISVKTVETHKARLMEKLDLRSRAAIVRYALHQGWLREE